MAPVHHRYDRPERFVAGTVGVPGERVFYIQARQGTRLSSVVCEKQQVAVLGEHLDKMLDDLARITPDEAVPPSRRHARDVGPLEAPIDEDFRVGTMRIAWDAGERRVLVELFSVGDEEQVEAEEDEAAEALVAAITPDMARDFSARAHALVQAGRPACPFCLQPINADGHICPRANGYRKPLF